MWEKVKAKCPIRKACLWAWRHFKETADLAAVLRDFYAGKGC